MRAEPVLGRPLQSELLPFKITVIPVPIRNWGMGTVLPLWRQWKEQEAAVPEPRAGLWVQPTPVKGWAAPLHPGAPTMLPEVWAGPVPLSCHRAGWHSSSHIPLESPCTPVPRCGGTSCPCSCRDLPRGATFHASPAQHCGVSPCATCPVIPWHWAEPAVPWHWGLTPNYPCANPEPDWDGGAQRAPRGAGSLW